MKQFIDVLGCTAIIRQKLEIWIPHRLQVLATGQVKQQQPSQPEPFNSHRFSPRQMALTLVLDSISVKSSTHQCHQ